MSRARTCSRVSGFPSMSVSFDFTLIDTDVSSFVVKLSSIASGASFTAATVPLTVAVAVPP